MWSLEGRKLETMYEPRLFRGRQGGIGASGAG
jgi:hypothetical protein